MRMEQDGVGVGFPKLVTMQVVFHISMEGGGGVGVLLFAVGGVGLGKARRSLGGVLGRYHAVDIFLGDFYSGNQSFEGVIGDWLG